MTVLDTFFLLFKTDAPKAKAEIEALEKQIDSLKTKGKQRSEQENKDLKEAIARRKEMVDAMKAQTGEADNLADSLGRATAALIGFSAVRAGMTSANTMNSGLQVQADLLQQNVKALDLYSQAAKNAGGSKEGALGNFSAIAQSYRDRGMPVPEIGDYLQWVRGTVLAGITGPNAENLKYGRLNQIGITDPGLQRMLVKPGEWEKEMATAHKDVDSKTPADYETARNIDKNVSSIEAKISTFLTKVSSFLGPDVAAGVQSVGGTAIQAVGGGYIGAKALRALGILKGAPGGGGIGLARGGIIGAGALATAGLVDWARHGKDSTLTHLGNDFWNWYRKNHPEDYETSASPTGGTANDRTSTALRYFMSKGYSAAQAAGIVANLNAEGMGSGYGKIGDGGKAVGIAQWHPDRVAAIMKGTGIDVRKASFQQQLDAVAWEMKNGNVGFNDSAFRGITDPHAAGGYFSKNYERPGDRMGEAMKRGQAALGLMAGTPMQSPVTKNTTVNIDKIEVQTQASDPHAISQSIGNHLSSVLGKVAANYDDGVLA